MIEAIIFDMDGVLVDSEYTYLESKTQVLQNAGFSMPVSYQYQFMGTTYESMWEVMKAELGLPKPIEFYIDEMQQLRQEMIQRDGVKSIKGAVNLVKDLHLTGLPLAIASSSPKETIRHALESLGILEYFSLLVSGEEVKHSKPSADIYLEAAKQLKVPLSQCLVFEDTKNGVRAAKSAEMYVVGFSNPDYPVQDLSEADEIIKDYSLINWDDLMNKR